MRGFRLGRIAGIDIAVDWTLLLIFSLVTIALGVGELPAWHPQWPVWLVWTTALLAALAFFASILAHELSHALVGRRHGIHVHKITLFLFGGMAHMSDEAPHWRAELWMALAGPLTSLGLGVTFLVLGRLAAPDVPVDPEDMQRTLAALGPVPTLLLWLGPVNLVLGLFNLVPGFPLDGGRILRAIVWGATGDLRKATGWAATGGRGFAMLLVASGAAMLLGLQVPVLGHGTFNGLWLVLIGWFLYNAATMSEQQVVVRQALEDVRVAGLMRSNIETVGPDLTLDALVERYLLPSDQRTFPVLVSGQLVGMVGMEHLAKVPQQVWARTTVAQVMTPAQGLPEVTPGQDAASALALLGERGVSELPVVEDGFLRGLLRRDDLLKWLWVKLGGLPGRGGHRLRLS